MPKEQFRLLAAIMFADIVGYTGMMQEDEEKAREIRDRQRKVIEDCIDHYHGRIIQYYGDGTLSIFGSAIEAVKCAVRIQKKLQKEPVIPLRIGLHLGDIVYDDEGAYGDAVNVASRIETLSTAGAILVSDRINDELKNHPLIETHPLGTYKLKNVKRPIQLFGVVEEGLSLPTITELQMKTGSGRKSIAVLPFVNMSGNPENDYFSEGMTEEIINVLTNIPGLDVAARTSVYAYKGMGKNVQEIGQELTVHFILEGSIRKWDNRIRVTAQLIDVETGFHLWSEVYERNSEDIFQIQDEISRKIAGRLKKDVTPSQRPLVPPKVNNLQCYHNYLKGKYYWNKWTPEDAVKSIEYYGKATKGCPKFAEAYAGMAFSYSFLGTVGRMAPRRAYEEAEKQH